MVGIFVTSKDWLVRGFFKGQPKPPKKISKLFKRLFNSTQKIMDFWMVFCWWLFLHNFWSEFLGESDHHEFWKKKTKTPFVWRRIRKKKWTRLPGPISCMGITSRIWTDSCQQWVSRAYDTPKSPGFSTKDLAWSWVIRQIWNST